MKKFKVVVDHKVTAWDRYTLTVKADSLKEAISKAINVTIPDLKSSKNDDVIIDNCELQLVTIEPMSLCENYAAANCQQLTKANNIDPNIYGVSLVISEECKEITK